MSNLFWTLVNPCMLAKKKLNNNKKQLDPYTCRDLIPQNNFSACKGKAFDKCIEITNNNIDDGKILQIEINNHNCAMNRRKGFRYGKPMGLSKRELLLVPSR